MKRIKVISDLHIGKKDDNTNDFYLNESAFIKYLNKSCATNEKVVIAGDLFECWNSRSWDEQAQSFHQICESRPRLIKCINKHMEKGKLIYIVGNHDWIVKKEKLMPNMSDRCIIEESGTKIVIMHGHQGDKLNNKYNIIGRFTSWIVGWFERLGWRDADIDLGRMEKYIPGRKADDKIYEDYAKKIIKQYEADIAVFGHTHRTKKTSLSDTTIYVNSGKVCNLFDSIDEVNISISQDNRCNVSIQRILMK